MDALSSWIKDSLKPFLFTGALLFSGPDAFACGQASSEPKCTCVRPAYPPAAALAGAEGGTVLEFMIDENGKVTNSSIAERSGWSPEHKLLDQAAQYWLSTCTFPPATSREGRETKHRVEYRWSLD